MKNPFIPTKKVKTILISNRISESFIKLLNKLEINALFTIDNPNVDYPVADHADISVHPINEELFIVDKSVFDYYETILTPHGIKVLSSSQTLKSKYPQDCLLNVSRIKDYYIHNGITDEFLKRELTDMGLELIKVKQGYSKCSTLILNCDTIVTSDKGIHKKLIKHNIKSHLLPQGKIELKGYDTGFIGGCGGMISPDTLVLSGDPLNYFYGEELLSIIKSLDLKVEYVQDENLVDIGSIIIID